MTAVPAQGLEPMRLMLEARCGLDAVDIYGLSEILGPGFANECIETKDGPTIWEDHFYPEIVDPRSGAPLPDGELGELVFTTLTKEALPMIRYRTRDLTRLFPGAARTMRRMEKITGRSDDMLIIRGVNVFPSQIEVQLLRQPQLSEHYQLHVSRSNNQDVLEVWVEGRPGTNDDQIALGATNLHQLIKDFVGISTHINVRPAGQVPRSEGKAIRVVDRRRRL